MGMWKNVYVCFGAFFYIERVQWKKKNMWIKEIKTKVKKIAAYLI